MIIDTDIVSVPTEMCSGEVPLIPAHSGARVVFEGVVRDHDGGEGVHYWEILRSMASMFAIAWDT